LPQIAATMFAFGIGAALRLLLLGLLSRETMAGWRNRLVSAGNFARAGLGILLIAIGALAITRLDKSIETVLVAASPQWLTDLTTRF
jgi:cytochrome c-type biogenesis protein